MHSDHVVVLAQSTTAHTTELLHVAAHTKDKTKVHAKRTNVGAGLTRHPEDTKVALLIELQELRLVDGTDTELTLDRRNERGTLEEGAGQGLDRAREGSGLGERGVKAEDGNVLLSCSEKAIQNA